MKRLIRRTKNNLGEKCKTYIFDYENSIIFYKYTLISNRIFRKLIGGEVIIRETNNYIITLHQFSIKKSTLLEALAQFDLIPTSQKPETFTSFDNKRYIKLTRDDLREDKKNTPIENITLYDFKSSLLTYTEILKAEEIVFVEGDERIKLKCRY